MLIKKITPLLVLLALSGCSFPSQQEPTANPEVVEEIVSLTLTAQALNIPDQSTPFSSLPTATVLVVTETSTPTITMEPITILSETPTITIVPAGFRDTLGSPTWQDTLDFGTSFGLDETGYQDDNTKIVMDDGAMVLSSSSTYGYRGWRLTSKSPANIYLEAKFDMESCSDADLYGLVYRAPDYSSGLGYYLGITCEGEYAVTKWTESGSSTIISSVSDPAILSGPDQTNRVGIQMMGNDFFIHINNSFITQFTDKAFENGGHFGVFIAGQGKGNLKVRMDEIAYWNLE